MGFTLFCLSLAKLLLGLGAETVPLQKPFCPDGKNMRNLDNYRIKTRTEYIEREIKEPEVWR